MKTQTTNKTTLEILMSSNKTEAQKKSAVLSKYIIAMRKFTNERNILQARFIFTYDIAPMRKALKQLGMDASQIKAIKY